MKKNLCLLLSLAICIFSLSASAQAPKMVISQIYGGAGCGTANCSSFRNDFIEIFNAGSAPQNLNGWSIQYAAATGSVWQVTLLTNVTLQPGQYYLIAQGAGANGASNIPTPDASGTVAMSATAAKLALVNSTTAITGTCPANPSIVDLVGYGAVASCNEGGTNAPSPSTITSAFRAGNGCTDVNNNGTDFSVVTPNPRNTATAVAPCKTLPVTFSSFQARYDETGNKVSVSWSTTQEQNSREFILERSFDGTAWTIVATVQAAGNSSVTSNYNADDLQPRKGSNLYRLKQVDRDGRYIYTAVIGITGSAKKQSFKVYPNPSRGIVYIHSDLRSGPVDIRVSGSTGTLLLSDQRVMGEGESVKLDLLKFGKGIFYVRISAGEYNVIEKVTVF